MEEDEGPYIQLIDVGKQFIINHIRGFLQSRIVYYLMNLHTQPRVIYLTRVRCAHDALRRRHAQTRGSAPRALPRLLALRTDQHGESEMNVQQRIGGDADLSPRGWAYARKLPEYFAKELPPDLQMTVWTSTFKRTRQTGQFLPYPHVEWRALDELDAGVCDGLTYEEIEVRRHAQAAAPGACAAA